MSPRKKLCVGLLLSLTFLNTSSPAPAFGQGGGQQTTPAPPRDEVLRISTDLAQTDVMVLDKQGRTVTGLPRDQFELLVDGQPQPILFFESVEAGGAKEAAKLAAARGGTAAAAAGAAAAAASGGISASGRSFIFFVDDLHLGQGSIQRARKLLEDFINNMGPGDQAMILSPSGSIGFLQQLTDNQKVLRLAASRINFQPQAVASSGRRAMTVSEASAIERGQRDVLEYKIKEAMDDMGLVRDSFTQGDTSGGGGPLNQGAPRAGQTNTGSGRVEVSSGSRGTRSVGDADGGGTNLGNRKLQAESYVKGEARRIMMHSNSVSGALLSSLETVARGSASLSGRKVVFFISDGFVVDPSHAESTDKLRRVVDAAARSGVAVYTFDSQGLTVNFADAGTDAFSDIADMSGGHDPATTATSMAIAGSREAKDILRTLAEDTGGRAILNRNDLASGLKQVIGETASYYVLAWKPQEVDSGKPTFKTLKVGVKGRPELRVLARKGFYTTPPPPAEAEAKPEAKSAGAQPSSKVYEAEMRSALTAPFPRRQMGVAAYNALLSESGGHKLTTYADLSGYMAAEGKGDVDFAIVVLDDTGKSVSSVGQKVSPPSDEGGAKPFRVVAKLPNALKPGLYQARVAARDSRTGRVGSSFQWIEVPDFKPGKMTLSSLVLVEDMGKGGTTTEVGRRFARASSMVVQLFVYNPARATTGQPDVTVGLNIMQGGKVAVGAPPAPLPASGDPARLEYSVTFPLGDFPPGAYAIQVVVEDRAAKTTATQQLDFVIE